MKYTHGKNPNSRNGFKKGHTKGFKKGYTPWNKGTRKPRVRKGYHPWNKGIKGWNAQEKHPNWKGGITKNPYSVDWNETLRRAIRERDNYVCQVCSQYGNEVHHIDYNKLNCNPNNLIILCVSCHMKTNYNRNHWLNYFVRQYERG